MDTKTVAIGSILIVLILIIIITATSVRYSQYIIVSRSDNATKYVAFQNMEIIDTKGKRHEIASIDGKGILTSGFSNSAGALSAAAGAAGDVTLNGKNMAYVKDSGIGGSGTTIGPLLTFLPSASASSGYIIFALGCPIKIAYINVKSADDDTSRANMQYLRFYLLNKNRLPIKGSEYIIPAASSIIPQLIYHIRFA